MTSNILKVAPLGFPWETRDPFLFCAHHRDEYPKGNEHMGPAIGIEGRNIGNDFIVKDGYRMYHGSKVPGFPYHPHRGFETITIVKEGLVDHTDSLGAAGRFGDGDVQWMTAGKGVQHSEMFPLVHQDKENHLEIFQTWLNLPKAKKFVEPHFKMLWEDSIPEIVTKNELGKQTIINIIAGSLNGIQAPAPTPDSWAAVQENHVAVFTIKIEAEGTYTLPSGNKVANRTLYFYRGSNLEIDNQKIDNYHSVEVKCDADIVLKANESDCYLLLLQGKPINEPVAKYGPFVMNTDAEIQEAFADYQKTQFGGWPWPKREQTHDRNKGRFALHADGSEENK